MVGIGARSTAVSRTSLPVILKSKLSLFDPPSNVESPEPSLISSLE